MPVRFVPATVLAMACSACTPGSTDRAVAESATATAGEAVPGAPQPSPAAITSLTGEWRVAGIDDRPFDEPYALALSGDERELWWEPRRLPHSQLSHIRRGGHLFGANGYGATAHDAAARVLDRTAGTPWRGAARTRRSTDDCPHGQEWRAHHRW